jgi:1-acyl-sn-glycerol-3-phosphate acyltransferase
MKNFWKNPNEKLLNLSDLSHNALLYKVFPHFIMEIMSKYFRLKVEGTEYLPKKGPAIIAPNHSGYSGFDAMVLTHEINKAIHRVPRVMTHQFWFLNKTTAIPANKLGFIEATTKNGIDQLMKKNMIILFPEGEYGNFKPTSKAYRLQEFKRGFVRMALKTGSPIIPSLVIGAEETHINLKRLKFTKYLRGTVLPLPLNIIPLPAKWKIKFLEPIELPYEPDAVNDTELVHEIAETIQEQMQAAISYEARNRDSIFL